MARDKSFESWYAGIAERYGLDPNPDDPMHQYDYRAAYEAGFEPDDDGHWPSEFKKAGHPTLIKEVDGQLVNTKTGEAASFLQFLGNQSFGKHEIARATMQQALGRKVK